MKTFQYQGSHPDLQGEQALGRWEGDKFLVQCDGHRLGVSVPTCPVDGENWAHGWHETPREHWQFAYDTPYYSSESLDKCCDFVRANRFGLECEIWLDGKIYTVFGDEVK